MEEILGKIRRESPLIHCISNYVTSNDMANVILATGASPIMADELEEVEEIVGLSRALLLNIGTINKDKLQSMLRAGKKARELGIPVVFDPVGVGASSFRQKAAERILDETGPDLIKGNISEIKFLYQKTGEQLGVDSESFKEDSLDDYIKIVKSLAKTYDCLVLMTGEVDLATDGDRLALIRTGNPLMTRITGSGCMLGGVLASFLAVEKSLDALVLGSSFFTIAGDRALEYIGTRSLGFGSFRTSLIDEISRIDYKNMEGDFKIEIF